MAYWSQGSLKRKARKKAIVTLALKIKCFINKCEKLIGSLFSGNAHILRYCFPLQNAIGLTLAVTGYIAARHGWLVYSN